MSWIRCDTRLEQCLHFVTFVVQLFYSFGLGFEACGVQVLDMHTCFSGERSSERERERERDSHSEACGCLYCRLAIRALVHVSFLFHDAQRWGSGGQWNSQSL